MNLKQTENWDALKEIPKWVDITFQEQIDNANALHPSFVSNNKEDVLSFSLKLVESNNKIIKFTKGEKNVQYSNS